jgi:hypothetical protein
MQSLNPFAPWVPGLPVKLCEACWQFDDGVPAQAYHYYHSKVPVCDRHVHLVCQRCANAWATGFPPSEYLALWERARELSHEEYGELVRTIGEKCEVVCDRCYDEIKREQARREAYNGHLSSEHWKKVKKAAREQSRIEYKEVKCSRCPRTERENKLEFGEGLHGHHTTYNRFGHEKTYDLELLCSVCHAFEHRRPLPKRLRYH